MALIKCKECGKEISDTVRKCPNCGYCEKKKLNSKMLTIVGCALLLTLIIGVVIIFTTIGKPLTELEQTAVDCLIDYRKQLKNPDSLQIHNIRWQENDLVEGMIFIYADVSGQNSFGGNTRSVIRYGVKENDIEYQGSSDDDGNFWEEMIAEKIKETWKEIRDDSNLEISVERVTKNIK